MKIQNSDHSLIGQYVRFKEHMWLVTGVMRKNKSDRGNYYRLWNITTHVEVWTKGDAVFEEIIERKKGNSLV